MYPGWAEGAAPYWIIDESVLGEHVGELEVLPECCDEADDKDGPEREAAAGTNHYIYALDAVDIVM